MKVKISPDGQFALVERGEAGADEFHDNRKRQLFNGQVVEQAQALSRKLIAGRTATSVEDFLAEREIEAMMA